MFTHHTTRLDLTDAWNKFEMKRMTRPDQTRLDHLRDKMTSHAYSDDLAYVIVISSPERYLLLDR